MTDKMTREEAKEILQGSRITSFRPNGTARVKEAIDMAIEALQFVEHFDLLKEFQSLQEVVRCEDCRHKIHCYETVAHTRIHNGFKEHWSEPIDFCSKGERKEE